MKTTLGNNAINQPLSFPRKRESSASNSEHMNQWFCLKNSLSRIWNGIPSYLARRRGLLDSRFRGNDAWKVPVLVLMTLLLSVTPYAAGVAAETSAKAEAEQGDEAKGSSGLPLPRFASLRSGEVNLRTGPGTRYPIEWVLVRKGMPLEITAEYDVWRRVRDWEGTEGWVHKSSLTGKRGGVITGAQRDLRESDKASSPTLAHLESGAMGEVLSCAPEWCRARFGDIKGYLRKNEFWGAYANEVFD
jgi:SH3-like domain-containing protein